MEYIYAALLLHKLGKPVDEEHLKKVISATGVHVDETKVKTLIAGLHSVNISAELENAKAVAVAPVTGAHGHAAAEKKEEKKEEEKPSESAAGLSALFG
ncbi:50S ribosomal protein P1 [Candidatus Pacearchaeota archaeon]|nr:50S ribosomal protein P1 [Candidatus Pacearchaeota archaeon]